MGFGKFAEKSQIAENQALIYLRMHWALPEQRRYNVGRPSIVKMNSNPLISISPTSLSRNVM